MDSPASNSRTRYWKRLGEMMENENTVELLGWYGGDETHAASAWTSTVRDLDTVEASGKPKRDRIPEILQLLAHRDESNWKDPKHSAPFEKSALHFLVRSDKATHIHIIKHRIGVSVNGESARYKELKEDRFLYPSDWPTAEEAEIDLWAKHIRSTYYSVVDNSIQAYHHLVETFTSWKAAKELVSIGRLAPMSEEAQKAELKTQLAAARKRAKESARFVLPHASQIDQDVMFNFLSFMHFQSLRNHRHAQLEVRELAAEMLDLVREIPGRPFEHSLAAFGWA